MKRPNKKKKTTFSRFGCMTLDAFIKIKVQADLNGKLKDIKKDKGKER